MRTIEAEASAFEVPTEVVVDAMAHVWRMLDDSQRAEVVSESLARWKSAQEMSGLRAGSDGPSFATHGDTMVVVSNRRNGLRDDLVYRLLHERFDVVYAVGLRAASAPEGQEQAEWLFVPPREGEEAAPADRAAVLMRALNDTLRRARQRCESLRASALRALVEQSR